MRIALRQKISLSKKAATKQEEGCLHHWSNIITCKWILVKRNSKSSMITMSVDSYTCDNFDNNQNICGRRPVSGQDAFANLLTRLVY